MFSRQLCSNPHCKRTSPGDGPTCRWHVRNYGSQKDPKHVTLCNACKINFDQGKYCPFCVQIYREKDPDSFDGKEWVGCDNRTCRRWVHVECEINGGNQVDSTAYYLCPSCRENAQEFGEKKPRCGRQEQQQQQQQSVAASGQAYVDNSSSEMEQKAKMPLSLRSTRRPLQVDLSKLETSSLKKYRRVYNLREVASSCKEELVPAVAQHFAAQVVEENETLLSFAFFLKKQQSFATSTMAQHQVANPVAKEWGSDDDGKQDLDDGEQGLDPGKQDLDGGEQDLDDGEPDLDDREPGLDDGEQDVGDGKQDVDAGEHDVDAGEHDVDAGEHDVDAGEHDVDDGEQDSGYGEQDSTD